MVDNANLSRPSYSGGFHNKFILQLLTRNAIALKKAKTP